MPEELAPVQPIGLLTLTANPTNFFAETEQVAFHPGNLVPGIDVTDDPLLQARLFSYLDTQLTRLGGPNFAQIPINRPHAPVNDMLRDGFHQHAVHGGVAPYQPELPRRRLPLPRRGDAGTDFVEAPVRLPEAEKTRSAPASFDDHFSQARLFWLSMTSVEQEHIIAAYTFELTKCFEQTVKERQLIALANIDARLCQEVATGLGLPAPDPTVPLLDHPSPALSQLGGTWPTDGRVIGIIVDAEGDLDGVEAARRRGGRCRDGAADRGRPGRHAVQRSVRPTHLCRDRSVEFDAVVVAGLPLPPRTQGPHETRRPALYATGLDPRCAFLVQEAHRHAKVIGAWGTGAEALTAAGCAPESPGVLVHEDVDGLIGDLQRALARHRVGSGDPHPGRDQSKPPRGCREDGCEVGGCPLCCRRHEQTSRARPTRYPFGVSVLESLVPGEPPRSGGY